MLSLMRMAYTRLLVEQDVFGEEGGQPCHHTTIGDVISKFFSMRTNVQGESVRLYHTPL
jgi:hypothetical protein